MVRINRVYTRAGDKGDTALGGGQRVPKDSLRIDAYGTVDELNSVVGLAITSGLNEELTAALLIAQQELFNLGSDLAILQSDKERLQVPTIEARHVKRLETLIDGWNEKLEPLTSFILPGGSPGAAYLHLARTVCRRAERRVISLSREEPVGPYVIPYLNRLSDALFVMSRFENHTRSIAEPLWDSRAF
ncbi:MAG: cob(I)yrinic acid a,c-diamide adenosyltransferase [Dehalococcoidia bacterium]